MVILLVALAACQIPSIINSPPSPTAIPTLVPTAPHETIVFCGDETGSYAPTDFHNAVHQFAAWVSEIVRPNESGASVYAQWITVNSYADSATYAAFDLPEVGSQPATPGPTPTEYPLHRNENATASVGDAATASTFATANAQFQTQLAAAQHLAQPSVKKLTQMPYGDAQASDIWGCPQRATERFAEASAGDTKFLVIASDMEQAGMQEHAAVALQGVHVIVIYFETTNVASCNARVQYWRPNFLHAGAASVAFYRPSDILPDGLFTSIPSSTSLDAHAC